MKIRNLENRIGHLEANSKLVTLSDGSKFRPSGSGLSLMREIICIEKSGREPMLSDFSEEDQEQLRCYSLWNPDPVQYGAISVMVSDMARKVVHKSTNCE